MRATDLRTALAGLTQTLETIARYTPTVWDDQIAYVCRQMLEFPPLFELVAWLLGDPDVQTLRDEARTERIVQLTQTRSAELAQQLAPSGLSLFTLLQYLPLIVRLLLSLLGKR